MKKRLLLLCLLLTALFASAFSIGEWQTSIYNQIKDETIKGLKDAFKTDVSIGKVEGAIVGQVVFKDVTIPNLGRANKVYVNYNLLKFAYYKDIVPAISKITIADGVFKVTRNRANQLNVLAFLPEQDPKAPPAPPFRAKLVFTNCTVNYTDFLGFKKYPQIFKEDLQKIQGTVSFRRANKIDIKLTGRIKNAPVNIAGFSDLKTGRYSINIAANNMPVEKWGNYAVPLAPLKFTGGKADLALKIAPPKTPGWPVSFTGNFLFKGASANFAQYHIDRTYGNLAMVDDHLAFANLALAVNTLPLTINGKFSDFSKQNLAFTVTTHQANLKKVVNLFPQTEKLNLQGSGNASFNLKGTIASPQVKGKLKVLQGRFYNQPFNGQATLSFNNKLLEVAVSRLGVYRGNVAGLCTVNFAQKTPNLSIKATLNRLDLKSLSQNSPGIEGRARGKLTLSGPINYLNGGLSASLTKALLLGQPMNNLASSFSIRDGDIHLEHLSVDSQTASIQSSGKITKDLNLNFKAKARGIKLSGKGIVGTMEATVDLFEGDLSLRLDKNFFASPLKNLQASGKVRLSSGRIGQQLFDLAQGEVAMGQGLIEVAELTFSQRESILRASGQTGIGLPTNLTLQGNNVDLADLKILNYLLPREAQNPSGQASLKLFITGELPKNVQITSLDPLFNLNASGEVTLKEVNIADIPIKTSQATFIWKDHHLSFPQCYLETPDSTFNLSLSLAKGNKIAGKASGILNLAEFSSLTSKYGKFAGKLGINLILTGSQESPSISTSFWLDNLIFNSIDLDRIQGSLIYTENKITLPKPVKIYQGLDQYEISGKANFSSLKNSKPDDIFLSLKLKVIKADLASALTLSEKLQGEFSRRFYSPTDGNKHQINLSALLLPTPAEFTKKQEINLYAVNGKKKYFLKEWEKSAEELAKETAAIPQENMGGKLSGNIIINGKVGNLAGQINGEVNNGYFRDFTFDKIKAVATLKEKRLLIKDLELSKNRGKLFAQGEIGFDNTLALDLKAKQFPLDILRTFFKKEFRGNFDLDASVNGAIKNPNFSAAVSGKNVTLAGIHFDTITLAAAKNNQTISIDNFSLSQDLTHSNIKGLITPEEIDLTANLADNALGLLNLLTDDIQWKKGQALAQVTISGSTEKPKINGLISLTDTTIYARVIDSEIKNISGTGEVVNNLLTIPNLTGKWQGTTSKNYPNYLGLAGTINVSKILSVNRAVDLDLSFTPAYFLVDLPNLFSGTINLKEAQLKGPLYFDFSAGPTLSGEAEISDAVITLAKSKQKPKKVFPLNYDLTVDLKKNTYAVMGDIATFDLSNIFMNMEIRSDDFKILGSLATPSLAGKIFLKRGTVTIFNREFSLLSREKQEKFYPFNIEKVQENIAIFSGEKGKKGTQPEVSVVAKVEVENPQTDSEGTVTYQKVIILSHLSGIIGSTDKDASLKISFDSFIEDKTKTPVELLPTSYSEQDIKVMLLPDFIKSLTGISQGDEGVDTNVVVADYISSRLQTYVFRGIERGLEQTLGLESLTLEYNFGKDVRRAMGVTDTRVLEGEKPDWRVGFAKGFFDKFYLDVNYSQFGGEADQPGEEVFNYQLTYKLSPIWSIIYYREPTSLQELSTGYQQVTLKAGFSFW